MADAVSVSPKCARASRRGTGWAEGFPLGRLGMGEMGSASYHIACVSGVTDSGRGVS